jgi:hypothetical protein
MMNSAIDPGVFMDDCALESLMWDVVVSGVWCLVSVNLAPACKHARLDELDRARKTDGFYLAPWVARKRLSYSIAAAFGLRKRNRAWNSPKRRRRKYTSSSQMFYSTSLEVLERDDTMRFFSCLSNISLSKYE